MSDINKVISKYYYDPRKGLTSVDKLYRKLKKDDIDVSRKQIKEFIDKQSTAQIHKEERIKVNSFIPRHKDHEMQIDLIYLEDSRLNKNKKYALTAINTFTKQLAIETLTKRDNTNVINAIHKVLTKLDIKPKMIYSDLGSEFTSKQFKELMKSLDIEHVTSNKHANMIERVQRTLKEMIA
jgi:transposase-like protein